MNKNFKVNKLSNKLVTSINAFFCKIICLEIEIVVSCDPRRFQTRLYWARRERNVDFFLSKIN